MSSLPLIVAVSDKCDLKAIEAACVCAHDRDPRVDAGSLGRYVSKAQLTWTRTDSPKREASFSISSIDGGPVRTGGRANARVIAQTVLERALDCTVSLNDLLGWKQDLEQLAAFAALASWDGGDPSVQDHCSATTATAWSSSFAIRSPTAMSGPVVRTMEQDDVVRLLPHLPPVVLIRSADFNNKGGARVSAEALHGKARFMDTSAVERLRLHARFSA